MVRFRIGGVDDDDYESSSDDSSSTRSYNSNGCNGATGELEYSDDDDENEPPHPLGFSPSPCRYTVEPNPPESLERYMRRAGYRFPHLLLHNKDGKNRLCDPPIQEYPQFPRILTQIRLLHSR